MAENLERLKQRIPLLEYLQRHNWKPCRAGTRQEFVGLCPLHPETRPSFYVMVQAIWNALLVFDLLPTGVGYGFTA